VLATEGVTAYDAALDAEVLIMSHVLCFQADSPMHAEVTNTPLPNNTLNPCRMCCLRTSSLNDRKTVEYVQDFLHVDGEGQHVSHQLE
jgi:hypothetical protein